MDNGHGLLSLSLFSFIMIWLGGYSMDLGMGLFSLSPFSFKMIMFRRLQHGPQRCGDP